VALVAEKALAFFMVVLPIVGARFTGKLGRVDVLTQEFSFGKYRTGLQAGQRG
jgi:hypothetical protein